MQMDITLGSNSYSNINRFILDRIDRNLHMEPNHPIEIIKRKIYDYFVSTGIDFNIKENLDKVVSIQNNFDKLLIPQTHVSRSKSDTYYVDQSHVLRTHTTAHQAQMLEAGLNSFLICGDVYRKDEIDATHYPIFHQLEGVILYDQNDPVDLPQTLTNLLTGLVSNLFPGCEYRVSPDYFPFTDPSFEIEVLYNGKWLEVLGCGVIQPQILTQCGRSGTKGIAWGLGLERLAMVLFDIPDIRYFWMRDDKFLSQFSSGQITKFIPFSPLNPITKDVSMFVNSDHMDINSSQWIKQNDLFDEIRTRSDDWVGSIKLVDSFYNSKCCKHSLCYRLEYSPKDYKITNPAEFNQIVNSIQTQIVNHLRTLEWLEIRG